MYLEKIYLRHHNIYVLLHLWVLSKYVLYEQMCGKETWISFIWCWLKIIPYWWRDKLCKERTAFSIMDCGKAKCVLSEWITNYLCSLGIGIRLSLRQLILFLISSMRPIIFINKSHNLIIQYEVWHSHIDYNAFDRWSTSFVAFLFLKYIMKRPPARPHVGGPRSIRPEPVTQY